MGSCDPGGGVSQFGAQGCKRGGICRAFRAHDQIHGREAGEHVASQDLPHAAPQLIAGHCGGLEAWNDDSCSWMARLIEAPGQVEVRGAQALPLLPAGGELRAPRQAEASRVPLARLPTPVLGGQPDGEALAPLLPAAGQDRAAPFVFHARAEAVLIDAPPIARLIRRAHTFLW